ncbi:hypothetical protein [Shewanella surugensis]|uniref:Uncharacterized protein n=1 Tax=Shewanella surugensis TaxID=212020 RepID=A0ABT0L761_9GAMM|nr:hypothetical protein [Shewanella surugensis]MCL1123541.1 hypothetical protein [Shewanella surugensis]
MKKSPIVMQLGKPKAPRKKETSIPIPQPIIGGHIQTLTWEGSTVTSEVYHYFGAGSPGWSTIHRHTDTSRPPGQQHWDTLAHVYFLDGVRVEYNAGNNTIVPNRHYY